MTEIARIITNPRRGRAVVHNGVLYIGGQVATDRSGDIRDQMRQTLAKIDAVLAEADSDKHHLLSAQIWMLDISRDFVGMNEIWDAWIDPETAPARATAQCYMGKDVLVEIIVTAAVRGGRG